MDYNNLTYIVFPTSQLYKIDFSQVYETSADTVRLSVDSLKTFVKYDGTEPSCLVDVIDKEGPYTHEEFIAILQTSEWKLQSPPSGSL